MIKVSLGGCAPHNATSWRSLALGYNLVANVDAVSGHLSLCRGGKCCARGAVGDKRGSVKMSPTDRGKMLQLGRGVFALDLDLP